MFLLLKQTVFFFLFQSSAAEPKIDLSAFKDVITVRAGNLLRLYVPFTGCPTPTAEWYRHDRRISEDTRTKIEKQETRTELVIKSTIRSDTGQYSLTVSNEAGKHTANIHVIVVGKCRHDILHTLV